MNIVIAMLLNTYMFPSTALVGSPPPLYVDDCIAGLFFATFTSKTLYLIVHSCDMYLMSYLLNHLL